MSTKRKSAAKLLFERDLKENSKSMVMWVFAAIMIISAIAIAICMTGVASTMGDLSGENDRNAWSIILGNVMIMYSFVPQIISIPLFSTKPLTYEQANGVVMSLLATEISPKQIWRGKGLAIFMPGCVISYICMLILTPAFMSIVKLPVTFLLCAFIIMPVATLLLSMITIQIALIGSVEKSISPAYILGFLFMALFPIGSITGMYVPQSIAFCLLCIVVLFLFFVAERLLAAKTTIEQIIIARAR